MRKKKNALGGFVYKSDKLIARCFRGYSGYISEAGIVCRLVPDGG